ncbi:hypothetical protein EOA79_02465 [Mesorhizobium sp. M1A.F.Ca.IN.020.03.2.1]|uniref:hypothetical protein n=1 Tax=Mesorhizobium sp. M1A.F.Ca.IN.020.03.2.1 TaxID=2496769 RepID=UPI000FD46D52|nr:hypothetical protein [Mesorhizobium sp. M1A.F.Ca.IN.020.03.2.1]RUV08003.1 hypothetical protein EOA79_02465 [Mesorhizobium sp. M1A.F.Ca.IN.020.03.2.1]
MIEIKHLLAIVDAYRAATGVEDTTVSHRVFDDSKKIDAMRRGGDITLGRFNSAVLWFSENWPEGAEWPLAIARPATTAPQNEAAE